MLKITAVLATVILSAGAAWAGPEASEAITTMSGPASMGLLGAALVGAGMVTRPRRGSFTA